MVTSIKAHPWRTWCGLMRAGGRQNATFGNVVELILSIAALTKGLTTVVAMSLLGSVLSNLLLVLGARPPRGSAARMGLAAAPLMAFL